MSKWTNLLLNFPEGATHVNLISSNKMQGNINFTGGSDQNHFWKKTESAWYQYDSYKGKYGKRNLLEGRNTLWRIRGNKEPKGYLLSRDSVGIMVKLFEGESND